MKQIIQQLKLNSKKERRFLCFSYILNVAFIAIMITFASGFMKTDGLSESDASQAGLISSVMIIMTVVIVAFFQWLIAMQVRGLAESRQDFNIHIRLLGAPRKRLLHIYFAEMLRMQILCVPIGCGIALVLCRIWTCIQADGMWIEPSKLILAVVIHLACVCLSDVLVMLAVTKGDVIEILRKKQKIKRKRVAVTFIHLGIAVGLMAMIAGLSEVIRNQDLSQSNISMGIQALQLIWFLIAFFLYKPVIFLLDKVASMVAKVFKGYHFLYALKLCEGFSKRTKMMRLLLMYSFAIVQGLYGTFLSARTALSDLPQQNIKYEVEYHLENPVPETAIETMSQSDEVTDVIDTEYHTLSFKTGWKDGSAIHLTGVTEAYFGTFDTLKMDAFAGETVTNGFADEDDFIANYLPMLPYDSFDGIIVSDTLADEWNLGEEVTIHVNGVPIAFTIYGTCINSNPAMNVGYVSQAYMEKHLGLENQINTIFAMEENVAWNNHAELESMMTKQEIVNTCYQEAVKMTGMVELVVWIILACSLMAVCTCIVMEKRESVKLISYLCGIGMSKKQIIRMFIYKVIWNYSVITIPATVLAFTMAKSLAYISISPLYYEGKFIWLNVGLFLLVLGLQIGMMFFAQMFSARKAYEQEHVVKQLRER